MEESQPPDEDKTDVIDIQKELNQPESGLLDRLLDAKPVEKKRGTPPKRKPKVKIDDGIEGLLPEEDSSGDFFSRVNRGRSKSASDDFEDLLLGGLDKTKTSSEKEAGTQSSDDEDKTGKIETGIEKPRARRDKKPTKEPTKKTTKEPAGTDKKPESELSKGDSDAAGHKKPKTSTSKKSDVVEVKKSSTDSASSTSKEAAAEVDNSSPVRAGKKKAEDTGRINVGSLADASKDSSLEPAENLKVTTAPPSPSPKEDPIVVTPEKSATEDGFELSETIDTTEDPAVDETDQLDPRGRSFRVSTESVRQSFLPPARVRARKVRRVIRHIDPWSVLTFSVLFHLIVFSSLLLGSVLIWQVAEASGIIESAESTIQELGSFSSYELNGWAVFRAAIAVAGIFTLASTIVVVILAVIFNLISDLVGGIRVTVVQEESVRVQRGK